MASAASPPPQNDSDEARDVALVAAIRSGGTGGPGDRKAWGELVTRHQDRVFATCYRLVGDRETAADLTQDAFVKVIQGLDSYDGRARLTTWMTRIAMNVCLSFLRAQKLRRHASLDAAGDGRGGAVAGLAGSLVRGESGGMGEAAARVVGGSGPGTPHKWVSAAIREQTPASRVETTARHRAVTEALSRLDPEQRAILILRDVQGLEYDQIAAAMEIAGGTVKSRLFRARAALREALEKIEDPTDKP